MAEGTRDALDWLHRFSPEEWLRAAMHELSVAKEHFAKHQTRPALASVSTITTVP